jgi:hypothetical protein
MDIPLPRGTLMRLPTVRASDCTTIALDLHNEQNKIVSQKVLRHTPAPRPERVMWECEGVKGSARLPSKRSNKPLANDGLHICWRHERKFAIILALMLISAGQGACSITASTFELLIQNVLLLRNTHT